MLNLDIKEIENGMHNYCMSIMSINDGRSPLGEKQIESNLFLAPYLMNENEIKSQHLIAFGDWTPGRHIAPGPHFPWDKFADRGIGLWSKVEGAVDTKVKFSYE